MNFAGKSEAGKQSFGNHYVIGWSGCDLPRGVVTLFFLFWNRLQSVTEVLVTSAAQQWRPCTEGKVSGRKSLKVRPQTSENR